jgi:hypothetical protein
VHRILLGQLTRDEAEDALRFAVHRHPALSFFIEPRLDAASAADEPLYAVAIEEEDFERYQDILNAIVPAMRPVRLHVRAMEAQLADLVTHLLGSPAPWTVDAKSIREIASLFEWEVVPYLLDYGDFSDGFAPKSIERMDRPNARGVTLTGACFFFSGAQDAFEAEIGVSEVGTLSHLALRFGEAGFASVDRGIVPRDAPDVVERLAYGYRTVARKQVMAESEEADERWAFLITKQ